MLFLWWVVAVNVVAIVVPLVVSGAVCCYFCCCVVVIALVNLGIRQDTTVHAGAKPAVFDLALCHITNQLIALAV